MTPGPQRTSRRRAVVLGGTGLLGRATAARLASAGWAVDVTGRDRHHLPADLGRAGVRFVAADRYDPVALAAVIGDGADLVVDTLSYTAGHARSLLPLRDDIGRVVMLSSKAVYVDAEGRHVNSAHRPEFTGPIAEDHPTLAPGSMPFASAAGYGPNKVAAELTLLESGANATVIRASKVHGVGAAPAREWAFVRRVLDRRRVLVLAGRGRGTDHTTAAVNTAALIECGAEAPEGARVLNSADPDAPSGLDIARVVAAQLGHDWHEVLLDDDAPEGLGAHPWDSRPAIVLDTTASRDLGYVPVGTYAQTVTDELDWLAGLPRESFAGSPHFGDFAADYAAEDAYLRRFPGLLPHR
ncbi:MAG: NAD-dependent epimerase/dehydratase family protein [Micrococcaceae bacterium]|nr:NAD-dependent epimerase/dehydratase family protein [Micrococcaceae bacterium]